MTCIISRSVSFNCKFISSRPAPAVWLAVVFIEKFSSLLYFEFWLRLTGREIIAANSSLSYHIRPEGNPTTAYFLP
jgi:hypothetical protein